MRSETTSTKRLAPLVLRALMLLCLWGGLSVRAGAEPLAVEDILERAAVEYAVMRASADAPPSSETVPETEPLAEAAGDARLELVDLRLVMIQMARVAGANGQLPVLRAQPDGRLEALSVRGGAMGLDALLAQAKRLAPGSVDAGAVSLPVVIQGDATLTLTGSDTLRLNRAGGAFLVNFGKMVMRGGVVLGTGGINTSSPNFRPFVVTTGTGIFDTEAARFEGLGFGRNPAFAGISVISGGLYRAEQPSRLRDARLHDVGSVHFAGVDAPEVTGSLFSDMRGTALDLRTTRGAQVSGNRFLDIADGDAIQLRQKATDTLITDNQMLRIGKSGLHVEGASNGTTMRDNLVWQAEDSALSVDHADCVSVQRLTALASGRRGVSLRVTRGSAIEDSTVIGSGSAGLFVGGQPVDTELQLSGNRLAGNRIGLMTAEPSVLKLHKNDFSQQFPRFLKGDLQDDTTRLIADLHGVAPLTLSAGGSVAEYLPPLVCSIETES